MFISFNGKLKIRKQCLLITGALFFGVLALPAIPVYAQQNVEDRINRLENDIQTLSRAVYKGDRAAPSGYDQRTAAAQAGSSSFQADVEVRLSQLEIEIRSLTGKIEQQNFEIRQINDDVERKLTDLEMRVAEIEAKRGGNALGTAGSGSGPSPVSQEGGASSPATGSLLQQDIETQGRMPETYPSGAPVAQEGTLGTLDRGAAGEGGVAVSQAVTPTDMYEEAFSLLRDKKYQQAETSFQAFLTRYPGHMLAANAKYWLGETFYVRNDFERAARVFAEAYQQYPNGPKGPDSLLKLAMSLAGMGAEDDACVAFAQIKQQYSTGAGPILARAEQEMANRNCP